MRGISSVTILVSNAEGPQQLLGHVGTQAWHVLLQEDLSCTCTGLPRHLVYMQLSAYSLCTLSLCLSQVTYMQATLVHLDQQFHRWHLYQPLLDALLALGLT